MCLVVSQSWTAMCCLPPILCQTTITHAYPNEELTLYTCNVKNVTLEMLIWYIKPRECRVPTCVLATGLVFVFNGCGGGIPLLHWFHVVKWKGQRWQCDTGSICGSLCTPLQAAIICYNPSAPAQPVIWHVIDSAYTSFSVFSMGRRKAFCRVVF